MSLKPRFLSQSILLLAFLTVLYFYITDKAIKTKTIKVREVVTVVDTVTVVQIEERWRIQTKVVRDTLYIVRPDTILISHIDTTEFSMNWKEWILQILYRPPTLEFMTNNMADSTHRQYVYKDIEWGFLIEPSPTTGVLTVQQIPAPPAPVFSYDYSWGVGYELGWGPALYGLGHMTYKQWTLDVIATAHRGGLRGSMFVAF